MRIVAKKRRKFMPRWLRGGALLKWGPFRAWIGSRLKPSGKCRVKHWGHIHQRTDPYHTPLEVQPVDGTWKITGMELLSQARR